MNANKIAIIGLAKGSYYEAPWDNPEWQRWGLPWDKGCTLWENYTHLFEMHEPKVLLAPGANEFKLPNGIRRLSRPTDYFERLIAMAKKRKLYMHEPYVKGATRYPIEEVVKVTGDYFTSSIAYMLALAICKKPERIEIYGVADGFGDEWDYQRPCIEYLIGHALARGIQIGVPRNSQLLKMTTDHIDFASVSFKHTHRYGIIDWDAGVGKRIHEAPTKVELRQPK